MPRCPACGLDTGSNGVEACVHHFQIGFDAKANRIWCDYFHRGVEIKRLFPEPLTDPAWDDYERYYWDQGGQEQPRTAIVDPLYITP